MEKNIIICFLIIFSFMLESCTVSGRKNELIKIGWFGALSGDMVRSGEDEFNTVKMLVEEYNSADGIAIGEKKYKLELIEYDDKGDAREAYSIVKRLTGLDKVVAIFGSNVPDEIIPIVSLLEKVKVPILSTSPGATIIGSGVKSYNFYESRIDSSQGAIAAGFVFEKLGARKAAIIINSSDDYSRKLGEFFITKFIREGGEIVANESYKIGDVDFSLQLSKIKLSNPDVIFMPYFFKEVAIFAQQARELGMQQIIIGGDGWSSERLISMGGKAVEGSYLAILVDDNDRNVADYKVRYLARYGKEPGLNGYLVHDAVLMLIDGLKRAKKVNGEALANVLATTDIAGIRGAVTIRADSDNRKGEKAEIFKIIGGKPVFQYKYTVSF